MSNFSRLRSLMAILIVGYIPLVTLGQTGNQGIEKIIANELDSVRAGSIKANDYQFNASNEKQVLLFLKRYEKDPVPEVRLRVQALKAKIAMQSKDTLVRQQVAEDYVKDVSGTDQDIVQYAIARLLTFEEHDFSAKAKKSMVSIFNRLRNNHDFILICGTAQLRELIPQFKKLAAGFDRTKEGWYATTGWYASLALARMGDAQKIDTIIAAVELELDPILRVTGLLRYVAYTRQPDCIKLLQKYLESSERLPSFREHGKGTEFNQYALEYLARYIEGFPIKSKGFGYYKEEIETARAFLKANPPSKVVQ